MFRLKLNKPKFFKYKNGTLINGDSIQEMKKFPENYFSSVICDPPFGLEFMGREWDKFKTPLMFQRWNTIWAKEVFRILKPGGNLIVFGGSRTAHRMISGVEDADFEIRDILFFLYSSGMPHGYNIAQSLEKRFTIGRARRKDRELGFTRNTWRGMGDKVVSIDTGGQVELTHPLAIKYKGYNSQLKPSFEVILWARKPLSEKNLCENVIKWGTGGINIDDCRIGTSKRVPGSLSTTPNKVYNKGLGGYKQNTNQSGHNPNVGRYPANTLHDGSDEVVNLFPNSKGQQGNVKGTEKSALTKDVYGKFNNRFASSKRVDEIQSASRFFYAAKVSNKEKAGTTHPTQKSLALMQYLVKMFMPPDKNSICLDLFCGSNSTGIAVAKEGYKFIGIEKDRKNFLEAITKTKYHLGK